MSVGRTFLAAAIAAIFVMNSSCELAYPEVIVVNDTAEHVLIRNVSFNGCLWEGVLAYGQTTSPGRCLPGSDRVHFEKFDAENYCIQQTEDGTFEGVCPCDTSDDVKETSSTDPGMINTEPMWFPYMTQRLFQADSGDFMRIYVSMDDIEQDFDVVGPYGH